MISLNNISIKSNLEIETYDHPDKILLPQEMNPGGKKKVLVIFDDTTIINSTTSFTILVLLVDL